MQCINYTSLLRNVKVKLKVNQTSIVSENGIFLFIPFTPGKIETSRWHIIQCCIDFLDIFLSGLERIGNTVDMGYSVGEAA